MKGHGGRGLLLFKLDKSEFLNQRRYISCFDFSWIEKVSRSCEGTKNMFCISYKIINIFDLRERR